MIPLAQSSFHHVFGGIILSPEAIEAGPICTQNPLTRKYYWLFNGEYRQNPEDTELTPYSLSLQASPSSSKLSGGAIFFGLAFLGSVIGGSLGVCAGSLRSHVGGSK